MPVIIFSDGVVLKKRKMFSIPRTILTLTTPQYFYSIVNTIRAYE